MKPYSKYVTNRTGVVSDNGDSATVDGTTFCKGEIVPYKNTRSNIDFAAIESFESVDGGCVWFRGKSKKTGASVWYGLHCSLSIQRELEANK